VRERQALTLEEAVRMITSQPARYAATIVSGQVLTVDGEVTGPRPGRLLRAGRIRVPA
jgi:N-acyl-D-aspartate/D-glutamate deacylase